MIAGLLALAAAIAIFAAAGASAAPPPPPPGKCETRPESKTDDVGRTFSPIYYCSTKSESPVYANPFDRKPPVKTGVMKAAASVSVICQKRGRPNPVPPGPTASNWWLYTQADKAVDNTAGYSQGWGYLPANVVTQATKDQQVPGVPQCPDAPPAQLPKPPPPPPASGACTDCDADGYPSNVDCNDRIPTINPGVADIPGNEVNEDCSDGAAPFPRLGSTIDYNFDFKGKRTVATKLSVGPARAGSAIRVSCTGRGCPFKAQTRRVSKDARRLNLVKLMRRARLRPGARLEVRVTKPATIGTVGRFVVRAGKAPKATFLCMTPNAKRPTRCAL
jgi:hypothetical protein